MQYLTPKNSNIKKFSETHVSMLSYRILQGIVKEIAPDIIQLTLV